MIALIWFVLAVLASPFKSKSRFEAENAVLQHQLIVCGTSCVAVSNSQTAIAGSLSSYIAGSRLSFRFLQSSVSTAETSSGSMWDDALQYLIRDRDRIYGAAVIRRLRAWASGTSPARQSRLGRMALPDG
jgi:hypothetical protein